MYVIVEIAGQQFKAEKGRKLYVHRLPGEENSSVSFDKDESCYENLLF